MQTTTVTRTGRTSCGFLFTSGMQLMLLIFSCSATATEGPLLDTRTFTVITIPNGNPAEAAFERISFNNGRFDNDNCHLWGFGDGAYTAREAGDSITFTATTTSSKEGTMNWKGAVKGDLLTGTMIWSKQGQDDIHYTFGNDQIEITDLDGRSFDIEFILGDSSQAETISFRDGHFESPGCYAWGFSAAPYDAYILDGVTHFQSLYTSENEGKMLFYGVINDRNISGTQFWTKAGQADIYYQMRGMEH